MTNLDELENHFQSDVLCQLYVAWGIVDPLGRLKESIEIFFELVNVKKSPVHIHAHQLD
jgi:hypothetical protein